MPALRTMSPWLAALAALALAGCSREHLSPGFGQAYRNALARQAPAHPGSSPRANGLDPQEAQVVADSYFASLAPKAEAEPQPVILVSPQRGSAQPQPLAPSVPKP